MLVPKSIIRYPARGGKVTNESSIVVIFLNLEARYPVLSTTKKVINQWIIPIKDDIRLENPVPVNTRLEKVWRPPLGT